VIIFLVEELNKEADGLGLQYGEAFHEIAQKILRSPKTKDLELLIDETVALLDRLDDREGAINFAAEITKNPEVKEETSFKIIQWLGKKAGVEFADEDEAHEKVFGLGIEVLRKKAIESIKPAEKPGV